MEGNETQVDPAVLDGGAFYELEDEMAVELPPSAEPNVADAEKDPEPVAAKADTLPEPTQDKPPAWAKIPKGLKFPRGRNPVFIRFRAGLTDVPTKGERQCIVWALSEGDERIARDKAMGDSNRFFDAAAKQMVRSIDGWVVDHTGEPGPGMLEPWWNEIGGRCRSLLRKLYLQLHTVPEKDMIDFFENCIAVRSTG